MAYDQKLADAERMLESSGAHVYTLEAENERLSERVVALKASLTEMLTVYWGAGDGKDAPLFIKIAQGLTAED